MPSPDQLAFNFNAPPLPPGESLPTNISAPKMIRLVREDFKNSADFLIITGFSSQEFLLSG